MTARLHERMLDGMKQVLLVATLVFASAACKQEVAASVLCEIKQGPVVECTATETKGTAEFEVCWDYKATCENGSTLAAPKTCTKVKDGGSSKVSVEKDKLTITGACDGEVTGSVTNLTIDGKATTAPK